MRELMKSEKEKMLCGEFYNPRDPQLVAEHQRVRLLFKAFNDTRDNEERIRLLQKIIPMAGKRLFIEPPFYCDYGSNITIGDNVYFNFNCVILDTAPVTIGSNVLSGPGVQIYAATHPLSAAQRRTGLEFGKPVSIGDDVWVGGGVIICPGVSIGDRSVVGAGSVVTKDIPVRVLAAGNPCRVIREIEE
jgi:maltose O-acetyltransferase